MDEIDREQVEQILRLTKDNNRMLRSMRRNAVIGGFFKLLVWAAFILIPIWLYMTYLAPVMSSMMGAIDQMQQMQGAGSQVGAQFQDLNESLNTLREQFPQYFQQ